MQKKIKTDAKNFFALAFVVAGIFISLSGSVNASAIKAKNAKVQF